MEVPAGIKIKGVHGALARHMAQWLWWTQSRIQRQFITAKVMTWR